MRSRQFKSIRMYAAVGIVAALVLSTGLTTLAYGQDNQQRQDQGYSANQGGQGFYGQGGGQDQSSQARNLRLEQQIASQLRQQGYGAQGEIMILATGEKVILLGQVPNQRAKSGTENIAKQASSGASIDNRLHVRSQARRLPDAELEKNATDNLSGDLEQTVQVQAQNGTVTLQGQLENWDQVADAIDAAFAAGATQVNSQFTVGGGGQAAGGTPYMGGYAQQQQRQQQQTQPGGQQGFQGSQGAMGGQTRASSTDLRLARQVASQLRQQLPPGQNIQLVQPQSIYVTAQRGTVILHGYVQNNNQKQQAQQIVQSIQGVQNVRNDLTILSTQGGAAQGGQGMGGMGGQSYGGSSNQSSGQGFGSTGNQSGSYQPQGYIPPDQSQSGMSSQDQPSQSQYGQAGSSAGQQGFGGVAGQSQYGQGGGQQSMGGGQAAISQSDIALTQRVAQQLKQQLTTVQNIQAMRPGTIYVMAAQGNVMLHGFITDQNVKQQASQIATAIPGVRSVANTLRVISGGAGSYPSYGYIPGQDQQSQEGALSPDMGGQSQQNQGMANQNQGMSNQNQGRSSQNQGNQGSARMQNIRSQNAGQSGQMGADNQGRAGQNQSMYGQNQGMAGQGAPSQADMALAQQVAQRLRQQLSGVQNVQVIRPGTIYVMVHQGTVTLHGSVPDNNSKRQAEQIAKSISGIQTVKNSLNIGGMGAGSNQALGFMPPDEDQSANQQFGNQMPGNQQYGNQGMGNQPYGNQQMGNQQMGNQSGNQMEDQGSEEDQSSSDQPDEGGM